MRRSIALALLVTSLTAISAQPQQPEFPIIDMHFHGALAFDEQEV